MVVRTIALPERVQTDAAQARFEIGEFVLTLPMAPEKRPRQIQRCYESSSVALRVLQSSNSPSTSTLAIATTTVARARPSGI